MGQRWKTSLLTMILTACICIGASAEQSDTLLLQQTLACLPISVPTETASVALSELEEKPEATVATTAVETTAVATTAISATPSTTATAVTTVPSATPAPVVSTPKVIGSAMVTGSGVHIRSGAGTEYSSLGKLSYGSVVNVLQKQSGWWQIQSGNLTGWMSSSYLMDCSENTVGAKVVALAKSFLGTRYVYGGRSPSGFDCSGFTSYIYSQCGYSICRTASDQWLHSGTKVSRENLQPGDLVIFRDPSRAKGKAASHAGIYIGNQQFIHSSSASNRQGVRIDSLTSTYYSTYYLGAKRIAM